MTRSPTNAALSLARLGSGASVEVLERMVDRRLLDQVPEITAAQKEEVMISAIAALAAVQGTDSLATLERLEKDDKSLKVRQAAIDARKAISMFDKVNVPILGLVENMAWFECDHGTRYPIFGEGGGVKEAKKLKIPLLGQIPINIPTRKQGDAGKPVALIKPSKNPASAAFADLAAVVAETHQPA